MAFSGILIMQNPFSSKNNEGNAWSDLLGSALALTGAVFAGIATVAIRTINYYSQRIGVLVAPMGFVIGNALLCPLFMVIKLLYSPVDSRSKIMTTNDEIGSSLHNFTSWDFFALISITLFFYIS